MYVEYFDWIGIFYLWSADTGADLGKLFKKSEQKQFNPLKQVANANYTNKVSSPQMMLCNNIFFDLFVSYSY